MRNRYGYLAFGLVLVLVALAAAGCGGGGGDPPVASLGDGATTTTSGGGAPAGDAPSSLSGRGSGQGQSLAIAGGNTLKLAQCMRAHGVPNFPDPNSQGVIDIGSNSGIDPSSSTFRSAAQACQKLVGGHFQPTPAQQEKFRRQALAFSACMRKHGVPDFPDPTFHSNGGASIHITAQPGTDLNPTSPTFQAARQACQGLLPFKPAHSGSTSGGAK